MLIERLCSCFTENLTAWISRRTRRRRAKNRRRRAKENKRKSMKVVTAPVTLLIVAAVIVTQIQTAMASTRARRERRPRRKIPVGITVLRVSDESRVRKGPPLTEAGQRALTQDRSGMKRSLEIIDKQGQRGEGVGAKSTRSSWREVKRERDPTAGTGSHRAAPSPAWTEVGAARKAGRTEVETGDTAEMERGSEVAQMGGEAEQQMGGVEAGKGERKGREAKTEPKESTDCLFCSRLQYWTKRVECFCCGCSLVLSVINVSLSLEKQMLCSRSPFPPVEGSSRQKI